MFKVIENKLIERFKCKYKDEYNNTAAYFRLPEYDKVRIVIKSEKNITFKRIEVNVAEPGEGFTLDYSYDREDPGITQEYINNTVKNISELIQHILELENAIRLLGIDPRSLANYLDMQTASDEERQMGTSRAKANLIMQYDELRELFAEMCVS